MQNQIIDIETPDHQEIIHYLGQPYIIESVFNGRFYAVIDIFTERQIGDFELEGKIIDKFLKFSEKC